MQEPDLKYFVALSLIQNIRPSIIHRLIKKVKKVEKLFSDDILENITDRPVEKRALLKIKQDRFNLLEKAEKEINISKKRGLNIITFEDKEYPELLKKINEPPLVLYSNGKILSQDNISIAIVGTRLASRGGCEFAYKLATELAEKGFTIISGMAVGIDTFAHRGALDAGGRTIAVMGSGHSYIYPAQNIELYKRIPQNGAVITEFPFYTKPKKYNFPRRNRIISGISLGTVIVEAGKRSGALITASFALEQGREVFAVPGPAWNKLSEGTNRLIKNGAKLVQSIEDILEELNTEQIKEIISQKTKKKKISTESEEQLNEIETKLLNAIDYNPLSVDKIMEITGLPVDIVEKHLMLLEIKGFIEQLPGQKFKKILNE